MKKAISVLLAVLMMFSALTVGFMAFAEEGEQTVIEDEKTKELADAAFNLFLGMDYEAFMNLTEEEQWAAIQSMDMGKLMALGKVAKIALKIVKVVIKLMNVLDKLGILDLSDLKQSIVDFIADAIKGADVPTEEEPVVDSALVAAF